MTSGDSDPTFSERDMNENHPPKTTAPANQRCVKTVMEERYRRREAILTGFLTGVIVVIIVGIIYFVVWY